MSSGVTCTPDRRTGWLYPPLPTWLLASRARPSLPMRYCPQAAGAKPSGIVTTAAHSSFLVLLRMVFLTIRGKSPLRVLQPAHRRRRVCPIADYTLLYDA